MADNLILFLIMHAFLINLLKFLFQITVGNYILLHPWRQTIR